MPVRFIAGWLLVGAMLAAQEPAAVGREKEAALGRQLAERFRGQQANSRSVQTYLDRISQRLAAQVVGAKFPFAVTAITNDPCRMSHEPISLPGGYLFIPTALFMAAEDESEFAGMLVQAMERNVLGFGVRNASPGSMASIPLIFTGNNGCSESDLVPLAQKSATGANILEADARAVEALAHAGFDPDALLRYMQRTQPNDAAYSIYTTLPSRQQRLEKLSALTQIQPQATYIVDESEFASVKQEVLRMTAPSAATRKKPTLDR